MSGRRQVLLGLFFLTTLSLLAYYTLFLTEFSLFREEYTRVVYFGDANGLRAGDPVLVAGVRRGRVGTLSFDPGAEDDRRITTELVLEEDIPLREGFSIEIRDSTLLGGKMIEVEPGPASATPIPADLTLFGTTAPSPLDDLGRLVRENRTRVSRTLDNLDGIVEDLRVGRGLVGRALSEEGLADRFSAGVESFTTTMENSAAITTDLRAGKGTIGRLLQDEELSTRVEDIANRATTLITELEELAIDARDGRGAVGRLVSDEDLGENVAQAVENIRTIASRLREGEGTIGRLLTDDAIATDIQEVSRRLSAGEGTIGRLLTDELLYERLEEISADLQTTIAAVRSGDGTVGKLIVDDELYRDLRTLLGIATRSLEEFREAAPVTTFTQVLFGAF